MTSHLNHVIFRLEAHTERFFEVGHLLLGCLLCLLTLLFGTHHGPFFRHPAPVTPCKEADRRTDARYEGK